MPKESVPLIDDPTESRKILDFLQECGWSKDLSLADILQADLPRSTSKATSPYHRKCGLL